MRTRKGNKSFKKRSKRASNRKSRNLRKRFSKKRGGKKLFADYERMFDFPDIGLADKAPEPAPDRLDRVKGHKEFFIANKSITANDLDVEDIKSLRRRKYYEMRIWDATRDAVKKFKDNHTKIINILHKFIIDFLITTTKSTKHDKTGFLTKFQETCINKLNYYLTGMINFRGFVSELTTYFIDRNADTINPSELLEIVKKYCINIRLCLTTIDFFLKTLESINPAIMGYLIESFDNCVRHRDSIDRELLPTYLPNKFCITDFNDEQVCTGDICIPHATDGGKDNCTSLTTDEKDLYNRNLLIEPYEKEENDQIEAIFPPTGKKYEFASGVNSFYLNKPQDTTDVFAAGISGHTAEIGLMFKLFTSNFFGPKQKSANMPQHFIAQACLTWMADYFHHSLREILLASCIHFEYSPQTIQCIEKLYTPLGDITEFQSLDSIVDYDSGIIVKSINSVLQVEAPTIQTFDENLLLAILDNTFSNPGTISQDMRKNNKKINLCYYNIMNFHKKISGSLKDKITWPKEETCNKGGPKNKLEKFRDNHLELYQRNRLFGL